MTSKDPASPDGAAELPPTALADLVAAAKEKMHPEPDRHGPAATRAMAAVVRDLKGLPELSVSRESATRLRLGRRGKVGFVVIEYQPKILAIEVSVGGFSGEDPTAPKSHRYTLQGDEWARLDGGGDLFGELRAHLLRIYPELA
jgi:hypothetical protein